MKDIRWTALNRAGTRLAVRTFASSENQILSALAAKGLSLSKIADESEIQSLEASLTDSTEWFSADHVNRLSRVEAEIIARQLTAPLVEMELVADTSRVSVENEFVEFIYDELTRHSYADIRNEQGQRRWTEGIQTIGEKYVGKGKMPQIEFR